MYLELSFLNSLRFIAEFLGNKRNVIKKELGFYKNNGYQNLLQKFVEKINYKNKKVGKTLKG